MSRRAPAIVISLACLGLGAASGVDPAALRGLLEGAARAMDAGEYADALRLYEEARQHRPQAAQLPFNMGVAAYRAGDFDRAAELFDEARLDARDPELRARSAYNLGTTAYRRSLQGPGEAQQAQAALDKAATDLAGALEHFREAIDADPADQDARANGELTQRWLKELQKMKQELQQQQQQQQQDGEQQQDQEQNQQGQGQGQQQQDQGQQQQQEQEGQQEEQQPSDQGQEPQGQEQQEQAAQASQDQTREAPQEAVARKPMTRQEAERLLQRVRDKERSRREDLAKAEAAGKPPVDKDW